MGDHRIGTLCVQYVDSHRVLHSRDDSRRTAQQLPHAGGVPVETRAGDRPFGESSTLLHSARRSRPFRSSRIPHFRL